MARRGPLRAERPLFGSVARGVLAALVDVLEMSTHRLRGPLSLANVHVAEGGARVQLGGLPWGRPVSPYDPDAPAFHALRERALARDFARILAEMVTGEPG